MPEWLLGLLGGIFATLVGAISNHFLTIRREILREKREQERLDSLKIRSEIIRPAVSASRASNKVSYDSDMDLRND